MMGMLVTGINKDILKLSTDDFTLYISGSSENKKFKATNNNKNINAHLGIITNYDYITETINNFNELEINNTNTMYPSFFEDGIYNIYLENNTNDKIDIYHEHKEIRENIITRGKNIFGSFKFNSDVGYSTFKIIKNSSEVLSLTIQVFPSKLDYMDDYNEILKDINEEITSLVFDFLNKTFSSVNICDNKSQTGLEFIVILNNIYEKLERAIKRIERFPKHSVVTEYNLKNKHKSKVISTKETIKHLRKNNNSNNVVEVRKNTTLDILENQYVKFIIKRILDKIKNVKSNVKIQQGENNKYYTQLEVYEKRLTHHLNTFFRNISDINNNKSISLVFKMASGYKECYYYYNLLSKALDISSGLYDISNKKLWNLYEIWCYIKIHSIIKELGYEAKENSISDYVIADSKGEPLAASQFQRVWQYVVVRSTKPRNYYKYVNGESIKYTVTPTLGMTQKNQPKIKYTLDFDVTPHQLRHTYITNLLYAGVDPKTVQYLAGHENSKTTMDIYAKVKYNKPEELFGVVNGAFHQAIAE